MNDYVKHAAFGAASAVAAVVIVEVARRLGMPWAMFLAAVIVGTAYEWQQDLRGEGDPSWRDALATSAGGAGVVLAMLAFAAVRPWLA